MTRNCNGHTTHHRRIMTGIGTSGTPRKSWNWTEAWSSAWSAWNWSSLKKTRNSPCNKTHTMHIEDCEEAPPLFPEPVLAWFFLQKSCLEARERNMILAATRNVCQLDQVEQAMKIQFPVDEIRNHDDHITTTWETPSISTTIACEGMKKGKRS